MKFLKLDKYKDFAPALTRWGIAAVFLWFGLNQIFDSAAFMGYLPDFMLSLEYAQTLIILNGVGETVLGTLLLLGFFIRPVALLLFLHLVGITINLGYNDIAVRDTGLAIVTLAIFLRGKDKWTLKK
jgi:uncharacterized membrane protein YphA (DoxX/SURF4 family)